MSLTDKINYSIETKELIKEAIQEKGVEVTDTDSFRSYADKIKSIQSGTGDISEYFDTDVTGNFNYIINQMAKKIPTSLLQEISQNNNITYMANAFYVCVNLIELDLSGFDTSNVTNMSSAFCNCYKLKTIAKLKANKVIMIASCFAGCRNLENFGGLENLGEAYTTTTSANYSGYELRLDSSPKLTYDSLMNVINNLYDIATKGCSAQKLTLGTTNLAKLTEEEIAIATEKGWTVS